MIFPARKYAAEVLQPGEQSLDLPAAQIAPQFPTVLSYSFAAVVSVRSDQLDAFGSKFGVKPIAVIGAITDQSLRFSSNVALGESVFLREISCGLPDAV